MDPQKYGAEYSMGEYPVFGRPELK